MIATGIEESVPTQRAGQGPASWQDVQEIFRGLVEGISRTARLEELEAAAEALSSLADDILNLLETYIKTMNMSANESQNERHKQNSNPNPLIDLEPRLQEGRTATAEPNLPPSVPLEKTYPLGTAPSACPDIVDYAKGGIANWRDFLAPTSIVRPMLGITPSAWEEAQTVMGDTQAAIVLACLRQRSSAIQSAGGYLRELTRKARAGGFRSVRFSWPRLMRERASEERPEQVSRSRCRNGMTALPLAKLASDQRKPNGQFAIMPDEAEAFVAALPIAKVSMAGARRRQPGCTRLALRQARTCCSPKPLSSCGAVRQGRPLVL